MLQKIKKIFIVFLALLALVGLTLGLFNFYSKIIITQKLRQIFGEKAELKGFTFNVFGELKCKEIHVLNTLSLKNLKIRYKPSALLLKKTISSVTAEDVYISTKEIAKLRRSDTGKPFPKNIVLPVFVEEAKINNINIELEEGNVVSIDLLYISGINTGSGYRLRTYINRLHFKEYNPYIYADLWLRKNILKILDLEISDISTTLSGVKGCISFADSLYVQAEYFKFRDLTLQNIKGTYFINLEKGQFSCEIIRHGDYELKEVSGTFNSNTPDSIVLDLSNVSFRKNRIKTRAIFFPKNKKLYIRNTEINLNENGFRGLIYTEIDFSLDKITGSFSSEQLFYRTSKPFQVKGDFTYSNGKFTVIIPFLSSAETKLYGQLISDAHGHTVNITGTLSLKDLHVDLDGKTSIQAYYRLTKESRAGKLIMEAQGVKVHAIELEKVHVELQSENETDKLYLNARDLSFGKTRLDTLSIELDADSFKQFLVGIKSKVGNAFVSCNANILFMERGFHLCITDFKGSLNGDSVKLVEPVNIDYTHGKKVTILDSVLFDLNGSPVSFQGEMDLNQKTIRTIINFDKLPIKEIYSFSGILSGKLTVDGKLDSPQAWISLNASKINYRSIRNAEVTAIVRVENNGIYVDSLHFFNPETNLLVEGFIPAELSLIPFRFLISRDHSFTMKLKISELPTSLLTTITQGQFVATQAACVGEIFFSGRDFKNPTLTGYMHVYDFSGIYTPIHLEFTNGELEIEFTGDGFKINKGTAQVERGKISVRGIGKNLFSDARKIDITLDIYNASIFPTPNIFANGDGYLNLDLTGKLLNIKGDFLVKNATIFQSLRPPATTSRSAPPPNLNLLINLTSDGNTFLVNELTEVEFKGKLVFQTTEGRYFLDGTLEAIRGYFLYLDRIFEIQHGYVNFTSSQTFEPEISILARTQMDTFSVFLSASGSLQNLRIKLSSEPPLDELNLLYLLTTGKLYGDTIGISESEIQELKIRALNLATTMITQSIRRTLKLHEFKLDKGPDASLSYLTVGIYVTPKLYFWYSHDLFDITKDLFRVRYNVRKNWGIFAERNQEQRFQVGADFIYEF